MKDENVKKNNENMNVKTGIVLRPIVSEMKESFIDYAMSVITDRALPDVRDGLKPVHRRILYAMHTMGLSASVKTRKSAAVVGEVLGNYHPHGDIAAYEAMVKMTQDFSIRYPLVIGQGNFGSVDGDSAAAMRYTEAKMSKVASELLRDIDKETVKWVPNYDATKKEPSVLPAVAPQLLLNGTLGIAVGMATNIPPHNLREVVDATAYLIDNKDATTEDLLQFVQGPDFPLGGIIFNNKDILHAYATGRGGIVARGVAEIVEDLPAGKQANNTFQIIITSIPYRVNKADLIMKIAELVRDKKIDGIKGIRDESTKDIRVVIDLKNGSYPQKILNFLYKHTQLEDTFHLNLVALVNGVPQTLSIKGILEEFIKHRQIVVVKRTEFDLRQTEAREHILIGLKKALDHIDEIIKLIKKSKDVNEARQNLIKSFKFSELQANAILEMRLQKLAGLERQKIEDELFEIQKLIGELKSILSNPKKILSMIKKELSDISEKYGDERRTKVIKGGVKVLSMEDLIADEENTLILTQGGYVKRTSPDEYRKQKRGGVGVVDLDTKEEDFVTNFLTANTHSDLLFFTDRGKVYQIKMYELPEGRRATRGKSVMNFISLSEGEKVTSILPVPKNLKENKDLSLIMVTEEGTGKKISASSFNDVRASGIIAIKLSDGNRLISVSQVASGDSCIVVTSRGQSIRFKESDVREMGRTAAGVRIIKLKKGDRVIGAHSISKETNLLTGKTRKEVALLIMGANGYGKKTSIKEYKIQKRGGSGIKTSNVTAKTGEIIASQIVTGEEEEAVAMSKKSQVIRLDLSEIPSLGRSTQGVRIMKLRSGDSIASFICL